MRPGRVYSVGYEGLTLDGFVERMRGLVATVVDVRLNPVSRRPGFSKRSLSAALTAADIGYVHERALGNPQENRVHWQPGHDPELGRAFLRRRFAEDADAIAAIERLVALARQEPTAVLCLERATSRCHRAVVIEAALGVDPGLDHLDVW